MAIAAEVRDAVAQGRKVLVLTERTEHLDAIETELDSLQPAPFVLHGRMSRKQRAALVADLTVAGLFCRNNCDICRHLCDNEPI